MMRGLDVPKLSLAVLLLAFAILLGTPAEAQTGDIILQEGDRIVWQIDGKERFVITADKREDSPGRWELHIREYGRQGCDDDSCWAMRQEILMWCEIAFYPGEQCGTYYFLNGRWYEIYLPAVIK